MSYITSAEEGKALRKKRSEPNVNDFHRAANIVQSYSKRVGKGHLAQTELQAIMEERLRVAVLSDAQYEELTTLSYKLNTTIDDIVAQAITNYLLRLRSSDDDLYAEIDRYVSGRAGARASSSRR